MKYIGVVLILIGILIQWNERRKSKAHLWLTKAMDEHIESLKKGRESTSNLPESEQQIPGSNLSFTDVKKIIDGAEEKAIGMTQEQLTKIIHEFESAEKKQEPIYIASYISIGVGTIFTVL